MKKGLHQSVTMSLKLQQKLCLTPHIRMKISEEEIKERVIVPKKTKKT